MSDRNRSQASLQSPSPAFSVAGLSASTSSHHPHSSAPWATTASGGSLASSLSDPIVHSRSHYQQGYLMSMSQHNASPPTTQRFDEIPVVQTKAKLNHTLTRDTPEFGKDPMFESSRQRQTLDEDAPPTASVNDIVAANLTDTPSSIDMLRKRASTHDPNPTSSFLPRSSHGPTQQSTEPIYVVIFGYPSDKYSIAVEYFKQLGETTDPDPNIEIINCFRIGYKNPGDALRAVRRNGEVINGSWMVGVKWADPAQAESIIGPSTIRSAAPVLQSSEGGGQNPPSDAMNVDHHQPQSLYNMDSPRQPIIHSAPSVETPLRLAPSASAFRKPGSGQKPNSAQQASQPVVLHDFSTVTGSATGQTPRKGVLGQMSDLILGW